MAKTDLNAFDVAAIARELDVVGARVDKAYQPTPEEVLLRVRRSAAEGGKVDVAIGPGRYLFATKVARANPTQLPPFATALRKYIGGGVVRGVRQHGFDRIVVFDIERGDGHYSFIVELFHDGNVVLVRDQRIVATIVTQTFASRTVRTGSTYEFPPARIDPRLLTAESLTTKLLASPVDVVRALAVEVNLGGPYAEEIVARAGVPKGKPAAQVSPQEAAQLFAALSELLARVDAGDLEPVLVRRDGVPVDVAPFPLRAHEGLDLERFDTFSEALDAYFSRAAPEVVHATKSDKTREEQDRLGRQRAQQEAALARFAKDEAEWRKRGDTLYAHFVLVADILRYLAQATRDIGWAETQKRLAEKPFGSVVTRLQEHDGIATLSLPSEDGTVLRIPVDIRKSIQENAAAAYDRVKKLREKRAGAGAALAATKAALAASERTQRTLAHELAEEKAKAEPTRRFGFEAFRWFLTSDGSLVLGGRDAGGNERVVKKNLGENDRYVHADLHGAPSLVVKGTGNAPPSETSLAEAAAYAVAMSKAWATGHASGQAYWVLPSQVSRTPMTGEHLARGAFVIRGKRNYVPVDVRLAIGEVEIEGARKVMCGPESAVAARSKRYIVIVPGEEEKNAFSRRAAALFSVPVEEVLSILPPGDVSAVASKGVDESAFPLKAPADGGDAGSPRGGRSDGRGARERRRNQKRSNRPGGDGR
ncbi:MAG: ribosome rescue protein RqcH [Thermoplasmatota archaeon]